MSTDSPQMRKQAREQLLRVKNLSVAYRMEDSPDVHAVNDVSFGISPGETFGIVGESGCGKTTAARSLIGLLDDNGDVTSGSVLLDGEDLTSLDPAALRARRWSEVAMIPQNVMGSLNPVTTVGSQIVDVVQLHMDYTDREAHAHAEDLFERVGIDPQRLNDYPHEFSGGMLQRAVIAMAISCDPDLIIADEPTTALDVVVQDSILNELSSIQEEFDVSLLVISHDIGVMAEICDNVAVMYAGEVMEIGSTVDVFGDPANPYTLGLQNSFPNIKDPNNTLVSIPGTPPDLSNPPDGCAFVARCPFATEKCRREPPLLTTPDGEDERHSRCHYVDEVDRLREEAANPEIWHDDAFVDFERSVSSDALVETDHLTKYFDNDRGILDTLLRRDPKPVHAVESINFQINRGEIFGIVGESGCGKSTLGRLLLQLLKPTDGNIAFNGTFVSDQDFSERKFRKKAQIVFQDPFESLNPRLTIRQTLLEPLSLLNKDSSYAENIEQISQTLEDVGLGPAEDYLNRFPNQLSGGERQRVAIARALVVKPMFILADEPVSMLDVSIRANVLNLLKRLCAEHNLTYGVISHDISLVHALCDRTGVMYLGEFVELGPTDHLVDDPKHPYTRALVNSVPTPEPTVDRTSVEISDETPSARDPPSGCRFHTRCPEVIPPANLEIEQERFREVMDLRHDIDTDALAIRSTDMTANSIRDTYFTGGFADPDAAASIDEALDALEAGSFDEAAATLRRKFESVCETNHPAYEQTEDGIYVACHLYNNGSV